MYTSRVGAAEVGGGLVSRRPISRAGGVCAGTARRTGVCGRDATEDAASRVPPGVTIAVGDYERERGGA